MKPKVQTMTTHDTRMIDDTIEEQRIALLSKVAKTFIDVRFNMHTFFRFRNPDRAAFLRFVEFALNEVLYELQKEELLVFRNTMEFKVPPAPIAIAKLIKEHYEGDTNSLSQDLMEHVNEYLDQYSSFSNPKQTRGGK